MKGSVESAVKFFNQNDNFSLICHTNPDGDTIGAAFGLYYALLQINKKANVILSNPLPSKYEYLYPAKTQNIKPEHYVSVDVASASLLGIHKNKPIDLCIDHHPNNSVISKAYCVDETAAATGEVVFKIIKNIGVEIDKKTADCLYTGICSDTGCFRYSNTTRYTHLIVSELLLYGADGHYINKKLFETKSAARLKLERYVLNNINFKCKRKCAYVYVSQKTMNKCGADDETFEGIPAIPGTAQGVDIAVTIRQTPSKKTFKVSVRTSDKIDAGKFCGKFQGGGHARAAGFRITGKKKKVISKIIKNAKRTVSEN